ncbi:hypothetical protein KAT95_01405 [Candidatus Parcubacteria bacterium]|nr:hypothetical protein [Candidatus Parcubacteria bacterium]
MKDLFGNISSEYENFTLFQDEAGCKDSNFFYHGYLLVNNKFGRKILDDILKAKGKNSKDSEITFKQIRKDDYRVRIVVRWLKLADEWLQNGKIRFYVLGVNKNNLKNFWDNSWRFEKNVYLRFFEIGLNSLLGWFRNDPKLYRPLRVTHIFYEHGNYNDERKNKVRWLESLSGYKNSESVHSNPKKQRIENEKLYEMSNLIQFTDVLLGVTKYSFIKINDIHIGKQKCIDNFLDVIERFNNKKAYNTKSRYYKRYALQFFPTKSNITKKEFLSNDIESVKKRGGFYSDRPTYRQQLELDKNLKLF